MGNPKKAFEKLGWVPETTLEELIKEMISFDNEEALKRIIIKKKRFKDFKF